MARRFLTHLMFVGDQHGRAEEAMNLYVSLFENSRILEVECYGPNEEREGTLKRATYSLAGREFGASDSGREHPFTFTRRFLSSSTARTRSSSSASSRCFRRAARCSCRSTTTASAGDSAGRTIVSGCRGSSTCPSNTDASKRTTVGPAIAANALLLERLYFEGLNIGSPLERTSENACLLGRWVDRRKKREPEPAMCGPVLVHIQNRCRVRRYSVSHETSDLRPFTVGHRTPATGCICPDLKRPG
jgi:hypothetical protein